MLDWGTHMTTLARLRKLEVLKLKDNAFVGAYWETEKDDFRALKVLHIGKTDLITWKASASHFPSLTRLSLKDCANLEGIPSDLLNVFTLEWMDIYNCNIWAVISAKKVQVARLEMLAQDRKVKVTPLKLSIYPPA